MKIKRLSLIFLSTCLMACQPKHSENTSSGKAPKYVLLVNGEKGSREQDRMIWLNSLDSGEVINTSQGTDISNTLGTYVIIRDSFLISLDKKTQTLSKYNYKEDQLVPSGKLAVKGFDFISNTVDLGPNQLYISGQGDKDMHLIIDPQQMKLLKKAPWNFPVAKDQFRFETSASLHEGKLYLGYSSFGKEFDHCSDTSYLAVLDYPALNNLKITKDTRSAFPGTGVNGLFDSFIDAHGDQYLLSSPVFYHGNHPKAPTAFYKIAKGAATFDQEYFFNLSSLTKGVHLLGITNAGNGQVVLVTAPIPATGKTDYYIADVYKKTLKLLLKDQQYPNFIWGTSGFFDGSKAYFVVNEKDSQAQVYSYDAKKEVLKKGVLIKGSVSSKSSYLLFAPKI